MHHLVSTKTVKYYQELFRYQQSNAFLRLVIPLFGEFSNQYWSSYAYLFQCSWFSKIYYLIWTTANL